MFTGIIESLGEIVSIEKEGSNQLFWVISDISNSLKIDQSLSHNGVCLTVIEAKDKVHSVVAIQETLQKSGLGTLKQGDVVNLERCMIANGRFDGHIVQGHVDQTGIVTSIKNEDGSWLFDIEYDPGFGNITVEKGSICVNGVSLTCFNSRSNGFSVAIIPYTYTHTNFQRLRAGDSVNLEFDIIGKYVKKLLSPER
jgi:riboflavin synthase